MIHRGVRLTRLFRRVLADADPEYPMRFSGFRLGTFFIGWLRRDQ